MSRQNPKFGDAIPVATQIKNSAESLEISTEITDTDTLLNSESASHFPKSLKRRKGDSDDEDLIKLRRILDALDSGEISQLPDGEDDGDILSDYYKQF